MLRSSRQAAHQDICAQSVLRTGYTECGFRCLLLRVMPVRFGKQSDLFPVLALLKESGLPHDDINAMHCESFIVDISNNSIAGAVSMERKGEDALLRSLVVRPESRWAGLGNKLTSALEHHARKVGIKKLYLSTVTAAAFFANRQYKIVPCDEAAASLDKTQNLSSLCPADAVCMCRALT